MPCAALHRAFDLDADAVPKRTDRRAQGSAGAVSEPARRLPVGVLATGAVGSTMLEVLAEREFPAGEVSRRLRALGRTRDAVRRRRASSRGALDEVDPGFDLALFSAGGGGRAEWAPKFVEAGAVVVDNSSVWRMHDDVPLVVAEVNPEAIDSHRGIVANPNCSTMQMVVALKPIDDAVGIERLVVSTYQSVSGTGQQAVEELLDQARAVLAGEDPGADGLSRTRSPSTCCRRSRRSRTATTTRLRSAR